MMDKLERRALYHAIRMNWQQNPFAKIEPWQIENYRELTLAQLFDRLRLHQLPINKASFIAYAHDCDSPEELTEYLIGERYLKPKEEDQIYLIIFELWRRLLVDKPSLSIICEELDHQINLYDHQQLSDPLMIKEALKNVIRVLEENVDQGIPAEQALALIASHFANDIELFLYDFISNEIDECNDAFAKELIEQFEPYLGHHKWFLLLRLHYYRATNNHASQKIAEQIIEEHLNDKDLEFYLEFISLIYEMSDQKLFKQLARQIIPLLKDEEDLHDFITILIDYARFWQFSKAIHQLEAVLKKRENIDLTETLQSSDRNLLYELLKD
jgi:hypothetical protein